MYSTATYVLLPVFNENALLNVTVLMLFYGGTGGRFSAQILGFNPTGGMNVCLL
jgi:hypothetical protein